MTFVYVLSLQENKYYIGKIDNIDKIQKIHFTYTPTNIYTPKSSLWTGIYRPLTVEKIYENTDDDTKITLEYMDKIGIDNVRGGVFSEIYLSKEKKNFINQLLNKSSRCYFCGSAFHLLEKCPEKQPIICHTPKWEELCCSSIFGCIGTLIHPYYGSFLCSVFGSYISTSITFNKMNFDDKNYFFNKTENILKSISLHKTHFENYINTNINDIKKQVIPTKSYELLLSNNNNENLY
jgi:hypothetical protein